MLNDNEKAAVPVPPVGAGEEQPQLKKSGKSVADSSEKCKGENAPEKSGQMQRAADPNCLHTLTLSELYDNIYRSGPPLVEDLLYPGTYLLAGAPKVGKSFLVAQIAYHVSTGTALWNYPVKQCPVLYLALEDDYGRLQKRLYRMYGTEGTENLYFAVDSKSLSVGLENQLETFLQEHKTTRLIIIDTFQKIRDVGGDAASYAIDYMQIGRLKQFAQKYQLCLLLVHHTRKLEAADKFDMISGTNGLLGAADGAFVLWKGSRTDSEAILEVVGRDQQEQRMHLKKDPERLTWELEKTEFAPWQEPTDPVLEAISAFVTETHPQWSGTATELVEALQLDLRPNTLSMRLNVQANQLYSGYHILYESTRSHAGRCIRLTLESPEEC